MISRAGASPRRNPIRPGVPLAGFLAADNPVSSALTRALLGWQPTHPGLVEDLDKGHYFHSRPA